MTGFLWVLHYLDDFLLILAARINPDEANKLFDAKCEILDFKVNHKKNKTSTTNDFLNIELNIIRMKVKLSSNKLQKVKELINDVLEKKSISLKNLQSFVDFLVFVFKMIVFGRTFFKQLYNALAAAGNRVQITFSMKQDFR